MSVPVLDRSPAPLRVGSDPLPALMVLAADGDDLTHPLASAAYRARAERRPLVVALVEPPRPFTIDAVVAARYEWRRVDERTALVLEVLEHCAGVRDIAFVQVKQPWATTAAGRRRALLRKADRLARRAGHELLAA